MVGYVRKGGNAGEIHSQFGCHRLQHRRQAVLRGKYPGAFRKFRALELESALGDLHPEAAQAVAGRQQAFLPGIFQDKHGSVSRDFAGRMWRLGKRNQRKRAHGNIGGWNRLHVIVGGQFPGDVIVGLAAIHGVMLGSKQIHGIIAVGLIHAHHICAGGKAAIRELNH